MRRLKRDVAADLPEKIEQVSFCELNDEQRAAYQQVMEFSRKEVPENIEEYRWSDVERASGNASDPTIIEHIVG